MRGKTRETEKQKKEKKEKWTAGQAKKSWTQRVCGVCVCKGGYEGVSTEGAGTK